MATVGSNPTHLVMMSGALKLRILMAWKPDQALAMKPAILLTMKSDQTKAMEPPFTRLLEGEIPGAKKAPLMVATKLTQTWAGSLPFLTPGPIRSMEEQEIGSLGEGIHGTFIHHQAYLHAFPQGWYKKGHPKGGAERG